MENVSPATSQAQINESIIKQQMAQTMRKVYVEFGERLKAFRFDPQTYQLGLHYLDTGMLWLTQSVFNAKIEVSPVDPSPASNMPSPAVAEPSSDAA